jgi:HD-GYP domain-containing protein (c-di-GMP phosphodiesterase class II)
VPAEILSRPSHLPEIEMALIKRHVEVGYEIIKPINFAGHVAEIIRQHHEKLNGSGYPLGLRGDQIGLEARILGVADVIEAMSSHRPYRPALGLEIALSEIMQQSGI